MKLRWQIQIIGPAVGVVGVVLGVYLRPLTILAVTFISGGHGAYYIAHLLGIKSDTLRWTFFIFGGILGIILLATKYEWALILLSSLGGATLVGKHLHPKESIAPMAFHSLALVGGIVQVAIFEGTLLRV